MGTHTVEFRKFCTKTAHNINTPAKNKWDIPLHGLVNEHGWFTFVSQELLSTLVED